MSSARRRSAPTRGARDRPAADGHRQAGTAARRRARRAQQAMRHRDQQERDRRDRVESARASRRQKRCRRHVASLRPGRGAVAGAASPPRRRPVGDVARDARASQCRTRPAAARTPSSAATPSRPSARRPRSPFPPRGSARPFRMHAARRALAGGAIGSSTGPLIARATFPRSRTRGKQRRALLGQRVHDHLPVAARAHQPGRAQRADVMRDEVLRALARPTQVAHAQLAAVAQSHRDRQPRRIAERLCRRRRGLSLPSRYTRRAQRLRRR